MAAALDTRLVAGQTGPVWVSRCWPEVDSNKARVVVQSVGDRRRVAVVDSVVINDDRLVHTFA